MRYVRLFLVVGFLAPGALAQSGLVPAPAAAEALDRVGQGSAAGRDQAGTTVDRCPHGCAGGVARRPVAEHGIRMGGVTKP